ncbi:hypothetical protein AKO1_005796 [Acrasis kona]|uniref:F-box domain-containing protein n=1 Tax=Acrasis kona TaxID=1008807 RepID=A0AAW2YK13_9EUKA
MLKNLPREVLINILLFIEEEDVRNACVCPQIASILKDAESETIDQLRLHYIRREFTTNPSKRILDSRAINLYKNNERKLRKFKNKFEKNFEKNEVVKSVINKLFEYNRTHNKKKFVANGGSVLRAVRPYSVGSDPDIDIFVTEYDDNSDDNERILKDILLELDKQSHQRKHILIRHNNLIEIVCERLDEEGQQGQVTRVQIVLRRMHSIEELLVMSDLDCCRFVYDGSDVYTTVEGIRALATRSNNLSNRYINNTHQKRISKYHSRGYRTIYTDNQHPLIHTKEFLKYNIINTEYNDDDNNNNDDDDDVDDIDEVINDHPGAFYPDTLVSKLSYADLKYVSEHGIDAFNELRRSTLRGSRSVIENITVPEHFIIASSFQELFDADLSELFSTFNTGLVLARNYTISQCYLCRDYSIQDSYQKCISHEGAICEKCIPGEMRNLGLKRDLTGHVAIVTGARIKIGYSVCLSLLRSNCKVIATTRFTADALRRFKAEPDYDEWGFDLLDLYPLDLTSAEAVNHFCKYVNNNYDRVHILVNNAAQTIRREKEYYEAEIRLEYKSLSALCRSSITYTEAALDRFKSNNKAIKSDSIKAIKDKKNKKKKATLTLADLEDLEEHELTYPRGELDRFGCQVDLRKKNTWNSKLIDTEDAEIVEVQAVNNISPTFLVNKLSTIMQPKSHHAIKRSYIINVTSHEGQFQTAGKTDYHIHTNMSKAALNMLTRSAARQFARKGILMNSVDTGWVSSYLEVWREPPLKPENGAARILHPIYSEDSSYGNLYKDYKVAPW